MKKIFLILFVLLCGLIFYQIILGKNGIIEGERIKNERKILLVYKQLLEQDLAEHQTYIKGLKTNEDEYRRLAHDMGFFEEQTGIIKYKVKEKTISKDDFVNTEADIRFKHYLEENQNDSSIRQIRMFVSILFYLFFGFFVILIIFSGQKME